MANASSPSTWEPNNKLGLKIDEFQNGSSSGAVGDAPPSPILVLSRYSALIETVRKAVPRGVPVLQAPDVENTNAKMRSLRPGILVIDTANTSDITTMVAELTAQFPTLVIVAAGQRDDGAALMQLTASGQIFRFLLVPLSHGQTRLTLDAALIEHKKLMAAATRTDERSGSADRAKKSDVTGYVAFAIGIALSVGSIWWFMSRTPGEPTAPPVAAAPPTTPPTSSVAARPDPLQTELSLAQAAFARGAYVEPTGQSALDYYRSASNIDPKNTAAREGLRSVAGKMLEQADAALTSQKIEDAAKAIAIARDIDPQHPRLASLDALMTSQRTKLSQVEGMSRRIKTLLADARTLTNQKRLVAPKGRNALDTLLEARRLDPTNPEVAQGVRELSEALAEEAKRLIQTRNFDRAQSLLASARQLGTEDSLLTAVESALSDARNSMATNQTSRPAPPLVKPSPAPAPIATPPEDVPVVVSRPPEPTRAEPNEAASVARNMSASVNTPANNRAERELPAPSTNTSPNTTTEASGIVPASTLRRVRTVEPVYPVAARRRKEKGMVEVVFTVTPDGGVENVEVRKSTPELVFDEAAKKAVEQWRFEPVTVNGQAISQRASARLRFSLD